MYSASALGGADIAERAPRLVVERATGHDAGMIYDLDGDMVLGRGEHAEIRLEDPFASSAHARIYEQGNVLVDRRPGLHQRHLSQRGAAARAPAAAPRRPRAHRRERIQLRGRLARWSIATDMLRVAEQYTGTDTGRQRRANEDSLLARAPLFVVADGMGGAQAGEVASRIAVESFQPGLADSTAPELALAAARPRGQRAHPRALPLQRRAGRHGHHADGPLRGRARYRHRPRRRQPRLLPARRAAAAPDRRPLARRRADAPGPADAGGGRRAPPALGHHTRARPRGHRRGRHALLPRLAPATSTCCAATASRRCSPRSRSPPCCWHTRTCARPARR